MCGIGGVLVFPKATRSEIELGYIRSLVSNIMIENEVRGRDAAGVAVFNTGESLVMKQPMRATQLARKGTFQKFLDTNINGDTYNILIHTRAGTKGSEQNNDNNHPIESHRYIGVHNGMIWNDDELFKDENLFRLAQVDSEVIFRLLDKYEGNENGAKTVAEKVSGSFTYAYVAKEDLPNHLTLVKHNNPVTLVYIKPLNIIAFASEKRFLDDAILASNDEFQCYVGGEDLIFETPRADTILRFNTDLNSPLEQLTQETESFKSSYGYSGSYYSSNYSDEWYYDNELGDWQYNWNHARYNRGKQVTLPEPKEKAPNLKTDMYDKLTPELKSLFDTYVETEREMAWNQGWQAGRESLDTVMEQAKSFAREEGYEKGYEQGWLERDVKDQVIYLPEPKEAK